MHGGRPPRNASYFQKNILCLGSSPLTFISPKIFKNIWYMGYLLEKTHQEPLCTWRMSWSSWPSWHSWWQSWCLGSSPLTWISPKIFKSIWYMGYLLEKTYQEPLCTWRKSWSPWPSWHSWWQSWCLGSSILTWISPKIFKNIWYIGYLLEKNSSRTSVYLEEVLIILAFLTFLMVIMMLGVPSIELDSAQGFQKYRIHGVWVEK